MTQPPEAAPTGSPQLPLVIDCGTCLVRGEACADCMVSCLLGGPPDPVRLTADEVGALGALSDSGMLPPLRLVTPVPERHCGADQRRSPPAAEPELIWCAVPD
ncbi:MAG: hypothetical protein ACR2KL_09455 [Nocardioidaceae bacterium]